MKILSSVLLILITHFTNGQISFDEIRTATKDKESDRYYPVLLERFKNSDSTLTRQDFEALYYGSMYLPSFDLEAISKAEEQIREANFSKDFNRAYEIADSLLISYPVSLQAYFEKAFACHNLGLTDEETYNIKRYKMLIRIIKGSGDGQSFETAWYANLPNDEFEVLKSMGLEIKEETELDFKEQVYDVFELKSNKLKMKQAYFNVSIQNR